ncbi:hypothetical protein RIR_jg32316.t1 [Rhizophagus irregularis DAOM 181602=DAOM 197198]|nr:hypothetical protein RIR_jg32316.t1 [Rhizophagus irregularis DAOM 181602=DAOM 197198]
MGTSHTGGSCPKSPTRIMDRPKEYWSDPEMLAAFSLESLQRFTFKLNVYPEYWNRNINKSSKVDTSCSARDIDRNHDWVNESLLRYPEIEEAESFIQQAIGLPMVCRRLLHQNRYLQLLEYHPQQSVILCEAKKI